MAYTKKNRLQRIIDIQEIYKKHSKNHCGSASDTWIYNNLIFPTYRIHRSTFYDYLGTNAKKELKDIKEAEEAQKMQQPTLF